MLDRPAPAPTETGPKGGQRLSPRFTEWMQGWPDGWVTDVPGVSRNEALKLCGNGVVPQQAAEALRRMLGGMVAEAGDAARLLPTPTTTQRGMDVNRDSRTGAGPNLHNVVNTLADGAA